MTYNLISHFKKAQNILITCHAKPDGDAIGSMIALRLALKQLNKYITMCNSSKINQKYHAILPSCRLIKKNIEYYDHYDTVIFLDCSRINMVGYIGKKISKISTIINIDHHKTNTKYGDLQFINTNAASTTEIVYKLISDMKISLTKEIADAIYIGILTDTGSFQYSNINTKTFEICNELMKFGVNPFLIAQTVYGNYSLNHVKLLNKALETIELFDNGQIAIITLTSEMLKKTGASHEDTTGLINYAANIKNVKIAALIKEYSIEAENEDDKYKYSVSLRSNGHIDVSAIALTFEGGGHTSASGFLINAELFELKNKLSKLLQ